MASAKFKGVKPGDVIEIETRTESGYAIVGEIDEKRGPIYEPITGGNWNRTRIHRDPATARQIVTVFRRLER